MPRKTKEQIEKETETKPKTTKKQTTKKESAKTPKKVASKKEATSKTTTKKATSKASKKANISKATEKKKTTKKVSTSKTNLKKAKSSKKATTPKKKKVEIVEYYDLPYRYNETVVKVLAQTPKTLFIYWDISDKVREQYKEQYGENFFETTKPILKIYNDTLGYSFEVEINDFANSWYLHVADSKCDYRIELGRKPIIKTEKLNTDYIYITMSNKIESPNDHILFNKEQKMVYFKNVKTGEQTAKSTNSLSFIRNMGKIYNIYDLYKAIYQDENIEEIYDLSNPSSGNPSSRKSFL